MGKKQQKTPIQAPRRPNPTRQVTDFIGFRRKIPLRCQTAEFFRPHSGIKWPNSGIAADSRVPKRDTASGHSRRRLRRLWHDLRFRVGRRALRDVLGEATQQLTACGSTTPVSAAFSTRRSPWKWWGLQAGSERLRPARLGRECDRLPVSNAWDGHAAATFGMRVV
jgi:hypothetical protein